jgi:hypothetical protein
MSRATNILDVLEAYYRKTRKPSKKRRAEDEEKIKAAENERQSWREKTFPKETGYKDKTGAPPSRTMPKDMMKDVKRDIEAEKSKKKERRR